MKRLLAAAALAALTGGCTGVRTQLDREGSLIDSPSRDWREVATERDRTRLREWRSSFAAGLAAARASGASGKIAAEGALLSLDAALPGPTMPAGDYRCRTIKLGGRSPGLPGFAAYPTFACRVIPGRNRPALVKLTGSQRPDGRLFAFDALRIVFLGTLTLGDEARPLQYGGDPDRDMAGYVERIGANRWRLLLPKPAFESQFDVVELTPAR